jgi:hypothetical protein
MKHVEEFFIHEAHERWAVICSTMKLTAAVHTGMRDAPFAAGRNTI